MELLLLQENHVKNENYEIVTESLAYGHIVNVSSNSDELVFYINGYRIKNHTPLMYGHTERFDYPTGDVVVTVEDSNGEVLASTGTRLNKGDYFSVFAVNSASGNIQLKVFKDNIEPPYYNMSVVQFINLSPDSPPFSIRDNSKTYTQNLEFGQSTEYVTLPIRSHEFTFSNSETGEELLTASTPIIPGRVYTIFTRGYVNAPENSSEVLSMQILSHF